MQPLEVAELPAVDSSFSFVGMLDGKPLVVCAADDFETIQEYDERHPGIEWKMGGPDDGRLYYLCKTQNTDVVWTGEGWGTEPQFFSDLAEIAQVEESVCEQFPGLLVTTACKRPD